MQFFFFSKRPFLKTSQGRLVINFFEACRSLTNCAVPGFATESAGHQEGAGEDDGLPGRQDEEEYGRKKQIGKWGWDL